MTNSFFYLIAALFGLVFGSFANVLVVRDGSRKSILTGRSHCPECRHTLAWYDLFPLLSYLFLLGKCRYCKTKISPQYPLMELATAALAVFSVWFGWVYWGSIATAILIFFASLLFLVVSVIDLRTLEVPLDYVCLAGILGGASFLTSGLHTWTDLFYGILLGGGAIALVLYGWRLVFKEDGMGVGDIWIAAAVGATVGYPKVIVALLTAVFTGAIIGILFMAVRRKGLHTALPFGPFLFWGMFIALVWGSRLIHWYLLLI